MSSFSSLQTGTGTKAMAQTGSVLQVGGALSSAVGTYYASSAQSDALKYQAFVAETNARLAEKSAQSVLIQGEQEAGRVQLRAAAAKGSARAAMAANGGDLGEGSNARVLANADVLTQMDVDTVQSNALRAAWGYRQQGTNSQNQAILTRAGADGISPVGDAFGSLLGSAGSVSKSWYRNKKGE